MNARERIAALARSFDEQDASLSSRDPLQFKGYAEQLERARSEASVPEACVWGWADIDGQPCALVVFDFAFLGGSMGVVVGEKVARAFDAARKKRSPVVTVTASGGARMQEGMWSLVQMAKTVEARSQHAAAGLPHVTLLTSPTTGGVYASFASLADVIYAEDDATVGFAGPRVVEQLTGQLPPPEVHSADHAYAHGLIDAVIAPESARAAIATTLRALQPDSDAGWQRREKTAPSGEPADHSAWERLQLARDPSRAKATQILDTLIEGGIALRGDRSGAPDDDHVVVRIGGVPGSGRNVVAIGQNASGDGRIRPQGFRKAIRAIGIAGRLGLPVVTVIDTRGADPVPESEAAGVASAIAHTFKAMLECPTPTVTVLSGEGGSGGALAMAVADRVVALENAVFSVIAPEGASAILYRDADRAPELAERLGITTPDLQALGFVDNVVAESDVGMSEGMYETLGALTEAVATQLKELSDVRGSSRLRRRHRRWRQIGNLGVNGR